MESQIVDTQREIYQRAKGIVGGGFWQATDTQAYRDNLDEDGRTERQSQNRDQVDNDLTQLEDLLEMKPISGLEARLERLRKEFQ